VTVYEATDARTGAPATLHVLNRRAVTVGGAAHFLRIYERIASLSDPHVAPVIDYGVAEDVLYYATARADGPTLRERLARERPLAVDEALAVAGDVTAALARAHAHDVFHGDLRPKHVTVGPRCSVVAGFGVAEALGAEGGGGPAGTGVTIGAPGYLSPEQLTGEAMPDARSDVYSFGCVLYEMLAGELPFGSDRYSSITRKLTHPAPSLRAVRESVPDSLDRLVRKCLARVPADRFRTADELRAALQKVREAI
jgi:serine/threonine-protein kinase